MLKNKTHRPGLAIAATLLALPLAVAAAPSADAAAACKQPTIDRGWTKTTVITSCQGEGQVTMRLDCDKNNSATWTWYEKIGSNRQFVADFPCITYDIDVTYG